MSQVTCQNCGAVNRIDESRADREKPICGRCKRPLPIAGATAAAPIVLTDANFASMLSAAADKPMLVDCWAAWCGPCRMLSVIEQLAAESNGRWQIAKLDTEQNPRTAAQYRIDAIPTLLIFKSGQLVDHLVGLQPREMIVQHLERARMEQHRAG